MTEATTQAEILARMRAAHAQMDQFLAQLTPAQQAAPELDAGWSVKDSLAHITAWETMLMGWIDQSRRGETVKRFIPGFTYDTPEERVPTMHRLNAYYFEKSKPRPLDEVRAEFNTAHEKMLALVADLSEEEIFQPRRYAWCVGNPLYDWIAGDTWEHYAEHSDWIKAWLAKSR